MKKENKAIKDKIIRDIRDLFEHEEQDYYTPVRVGNFSSNNYIEYERTKWLQRDSNAQPLSS